MASSARYSLQPPTTRRPEPGEFHEKLFPDLTHYTVHVTSEEFATILFGISILQQLIHQGGDDLIRSGCWESFFARFACIATIRENCLTKWCLHAIRSKGDIRDKIRTVTDMVNSNEIYHVIDMTEKHVRRYDIRVGRINKSTNHIDRANTATLRNRFDNRIF